MTVKDLIDKLKNFDPDLKVGKSDYFGDILDVTAIYKNDKGFIEFDMEDDLWANEY